MATQRRSIEFSSRSCRRRARRRRLSLVFAIANASFAPQFGCGDDASEPLWKERPIAAEGNADGGNSNGAPIDGANAGMRGSASSPGGAPTPAEGEGTAQAGEPACAPARSAERIPVRTPTTPDATMKDEPVFTRDLFNKFYKLCGGCHVDGASGSFRVENLTQFAPAALAHQEQIRTRLRSNDPNLFMPPAAAGGMPWSSRSDSDPVRELFELLNLWFTAGAPSEVFYRPGLGAPRLTSPYLLSPELGAALTNLGTCIPSATTVGRSADAPQALDAMFQAATKLPERLDQTDLTSFDSEKLAQLGVVSYAPAYPLFSDDARKLRHVRVPRGQAITFDAGEQEFRIPSNTRFYKTFFKRVIDTSGRERFRKMETRLIVSRPDGPDASDGSHEVQALFGSYAWNEDETEARLVTDPLRNGKPFADRLITYFTDEGKAEEVLRGKPLRPVVALREAGVTRTYAIPGGARCEQCHAGSSSRSFSLGFTPLQLARRRADEGGVIEASGADELTQLSRLIEYRVLAGIASQTEVHGLEDSQGDRKPRNAYELKAQGYMLGNCAHCHNPRGYATLQNPQLRDMLRLLPNRDGGIFQFPLERTSPRIKRGERQDVSIPYITPSLFDRETPDQDVVAHHKQYLPVNKSGEAHHQAAPWRSLIYRNVDTPFTYADDYALFPHMPMNAPGFDCRAPRIMGDWMVSIPARKADPSVNERWDVDYARNVAAATATQSPQPYVEVRPGERDYDAAVENAARRLDLYHRGGEDQNVFNTNYDPVRSTKTIQHGRYDEYCPDTSDIVDPGVGIGSELDTPRLAPQDESRLPSLVAAGTDLSADVNVALLVMKADGVPDRPHWVETDTTEPPGDWAPRRSDWSNILIQQHLEGLDDRQKTVVSLVQAVSADDGFRAFALGVEPMGLWIPKAGCNFASVPKVKLIPSQARPHWLNARVSAATTDADKAAVEELPVYMQSPGATVFSEICINCHGPRFDSRGRQADTLMLMTGGATRVPNMREGFLGPSATPGANRTRVFDPFQNAASTGRDWAARYVAWMGLGGTRRTIPATILSVVGTTEVLGAKRQGVLPVTDANMLTLAQTLCGHVLGLKEGREIAFDPNTGSILHESKDGTSLVSSNGDAEMWLRICSFRNSPPVRIVSVVPPFSQQDSGRFFRVGLRGWYRPDAYPAQAPVGDERGLVRAGIQAENLAPWCVVGPTDEASHAIADQYIATERAGRQLPYCPTYWLEDPANVSALSPKELEDWTLRGAINAGVVVFFQLDQRLRDEQSGKRPLPPYDRCEDIAPSQ